MPACIERKRGGRLSISVRELSAVEQRRLGRYRIWPRTRRDHQSKVSNAAFLLGSN
jgi:hypothetical protein